MRIGLALSLLLLLLVFPAGCGGGHKGPSESASAMAKVHGAFTGAGLQRSRNAFVTQFEGGELESGGGLVTEHWDSDPTAFAASVTIERFKTEKLARYVMETGGNIERGDGSQIRPVARVGNVVITVDDNATPQERLRVKRAVATLRKG